jgi:hypothetical protein
MSPTVGVMFSLASFPVSYWRLSNGGEKRRKQLGQIIYAHLNSLHPGLNHLHEGYSALQKLCLWREGLIFGTSLYSNAVRISWGP